MRIGVIISDEPRINDEIRVSQVRLIGPNGAGKSYKTSDRSELATA